MGSAAAWRLAQRGARVIGLDRFTPLHDRGSSHGRTRICRKAYFEHPDYVPLLTRAYRLWEQLEHETHTRLFERCGLLLIDDENGPVVAGVRRAAARHNLEIEPLTADDVRRRFPAFRIPPTQTALFERDAGYLHAERCLEAMQRRAVAAGADLRWETQVRAWRADRAGVVVRTDDGVLEAGSLVLCAGPWSAELLGELNPPLSVLRTVQHWFAAFDPQSLTPPAFPVYGWQTAMGFFYGFPSLDGRTVKAAEHGGRPAARGADALVREI
ncbi:MAG: N-methyl-L-tryptophan oxidase, partial [Planctomycetota bacterium]